jgi:hypothetical protein
MIRFTLHAVEMMEARAIDRAWVTDTVERPSRIALDPRDVSLTRSYRAIPEAKGRVLRVVHRLDGRDRLIITVHFDRDARP